MQGSAEGVQFVWFTERQRLCNAACHVCSQSTWQQTHIKTWFSHPPRSIQQCCTWLLPFFHFCFGFSYFCSWDLCPFLPCMSPGIVTTGLFHFQPRCHTRRSNLCFVFHFLFHVIESLGIPVHVQFCYVRFSSFDANLSDWLPGLEDHLCSNLLCKLGHETLT